MLGEVKSATISLRGGKWFVSIQAEKEVPTLVSTAVDAIGIDVGIARLATFSNSDFIATLNSFKRYEQRLACYQRQITSLFHLQAGANRQQQGTWHFNDQNKMDACLFR